MKQFSNLKGFTLFETLVGVIVLGVVAVAVAQILISAQISWSKQSRNVILFDKARWALEFMSNEVREGGNVNSGTVAGVPETLCFEIDTDGDNIEDTRVWYWRGATVGPWYYGETNILYRGVDNPPMQPSLVQSLRDEARANRQELANLIVDNPDGNNIFNENGGVVTIELTVNKDNRFYTLRTKVRPRN